MASQSNTANNTNGAFAHKKWRKKECVAQLCKKRNECKNP